MADEGGTEPLASGENQLRPCLYFILDDSAAAGWGHAALIVCDGTGYFYYSYGPTWKGYGPTGLITATFPDWASALAYAKSGDPVNKYTYEAHWNVTASQALGAKAKAAAYANTTYDLMTHNCWNMVYDAISSAVPGKIVNRGPSSNINYKYNKWLANGYSEL